MKRITITLLYVAVFLVGVAASAAPTKLYDNYEAVRQGLLKGSLSDTQTAAKNLANTARAENQPKIADRAAALANAASLKGARDSFAMLSDELIRFRDAQSGDNPAVVYCAMHKASWLQQKGAIANPYAEEASMRSCGQFRSDPAAPAAPSQHHGH